ncbi:MAG: ABC transporter substrate-binding protein [Firmicutes bacterium]|nr:ABC transporter substrate-binding protein [Bacillota bacterium]
MKRFLTVATAIALMLAFTLAGYAKSPVVINMFVGKDQSGANQELVDMFNATHEDIQINYQEMPPSTTEQHDKYVTVLAARDSSIDVLSSDIPWVPEFASAGWLLPLDDMFTEQDEYFAGPLLGTTYQRQVYAVPWFNNAGMLFYRKDLLEEAGLEPPETFDELVEIAQKLQTPDRYGFVFQGMQYEGVVCAWLEMFWGMGGQMLDPDGKLIADEKIVAESLQWLGDLVHKHKITPPAVTTWKEAESQAIFVEGKSVFHRGWPSVYTYAQNPATSKIVGKVGIVPMVHAPGEQSAATLGTWNLSISRFSKHPKEAWEVVKFMTSHEAQKIKAIMGGNPPARRSVYTDAEVLEMYPHFQQFYDVFMGALPRPVTPAYPQMSVEAIQPQIAAVLAGTKTGEEAAPAMLKDMQRILDQAKQ